MRLRPAHPKGLKTERPALPCRRFFRSPDDCLPALAYLSRLPATPEASRRRGRHIGEQGDEQCAETGVADGDDLANRSPTCVRIVSNGYPAPLSGAPCRSGREADASIVHCGPQRMFCPPCGSPPLYAAMRLGPARESQLPPHRHSRGDDDA
jgi:hypothetical protein